MIEPRQLHRVARQRLPLARHARPRRSASRSIRASPRPRCSTASNGEVVGVATGDMGIGKNGEHKDGFTRGMELRAKYTLFAEGARGSLSKQLIAQFGLAEGSRAAEVRHRPEGAVAGRAGQAQAGPGAAHIRLAARQCDRRRLVPLSLRRQPGRRSASSCTSTTRTRICRPSRNSSASRRIRLIRDTLRGRQAPRLWRARDHRGRLAVGAQAGLPRRRADRLRGGLRQRAAHQGQPQRHAVRHAGGRARRRRRCRTAASATSSSSYENEWRATEIGRDLKRVRNVKPLWSKLGTHARHRARRPRHVDQHAVRLLARSAR